MQRQGTKNYWADITNFIDVCYIIFTVATTFHHVVYDPFTIESKTTMIVSIIFNTLRSFKYLRIFQCFGPIVYMLSKVLVDLRIFLLFYFILIAFFSLILSVIGISNPRYFINKEYYKYSY